MLRFIIKRCAMGVVLIFLVLTLIFLAVRAVPGDPALVLLGSGQAGGTVSASALEAVRKQLGLNLPLTVQYVNFLGDVVRGNLGNSFDGGTPVMSLIATRLPYTLELVAAATLIALAAGIPLGSLAARRGGKVDALISSLTSIGIAIPVFVLGALLIYVFALSLRWFPTGGSVGWSQPIAHYRSLILPAVALSISFLSVITRMTRSSVLEVSNQDWVRTARALGLKPRAVYRRHVLRNALTPIVTTAGLQIGTLIGSTVMVEAVFGYPGVSSLLVTSVTDRDYPTVQGIVIIISVFFIIINLLVDIIYGVLDPRVGRRS